MFVRTAYTHTDISYYMYYLLLYSLQASARLPKGEREAGGDKVSKEATLRAAVDRRLHRFWAALAPSFDAFILELKATRARSAGTAFAYDVSPEPAPQVARQVGTGSPPGEPQGDGQGAGGSKRRPRARRHGRNAAGLPPLHVRRLGAQVQGRLRRTVQVPSNFTDSEDESSNAARRVPV